VATTKNTGFYRESDMLHPVAHGMYELMAESEECHVFAECATDSGVADIVIACLDRRVADRRLEAGIGSVSETAQIKVLSVLSPSNSLDLGCIAKYTGYSRGYLKSRVIPPLVEHNYVLPIGASYCRNQAYQDVFSHIDAVELKRSAWTRGLFQARRYLRFADRAFLALDAAFAHRVLPFAENIRRQSIGLLLVDSQDGHIETVVAAPTEKPRSHQDRLLVSERLWGALASAPCNQERESLKVTAAILEPIRPGVWERSHLAGAESDPANPATSVPCELVPEQELGGSLSSGSWSYVLRS